MRRIFVWFLALITALSVGVPAYAADGSVTYSGDAGEFIFAPGSKYSPTDLFDNYKSVMPGDTLYQGITVKNDASNKVKVKIYMRALGAHPESEEFLSQLHLTVAKRPDNTMGYMFDAAADETAGLTEWVCLGTLYSGGVVDLDVVLTVPTTLDNEFQELIGYLDWEFMIEEYPIEPGDPQTGDSSRIGLWITLAVVSVILLPVIIIVKRRKKQSEED